GTPLGVAKLGLLANARVGLINLSANYGISYRFEVTMNLPLVVVDAHAAQRFTTNCGALGKSPREAPLSGFPFVNNSVQASIAGLNARLQPCGTPPNPLFLALRRETLRDLGFQFNEGTHTGVGRISIGGKAMLYNGDRLQVAGAPEFFFPS